jgi:hypothetical protein
MLKEKARRGRHVMERLLDLETIDTAGNGINSDKIFRFFLLFFFRFWKKGMRSFIYDIGYCLLLNAAGKSHAGTRDVFRGFNLPEGTFSPRVFGGQV